MRQILVNALLLWLLAGLTFKVICICELTLLPLSPTLQASFRNSEISLYGSCEEWVGNLGVLVPSFEATKLRSDMGHMTVVWFSWMTAVSIMTLVRSADPPPKLETVSWEESISNHCENFSRDKLA